MTLKRGLFVLALNMQCGGSALPERVEILPAGEQITGRDGRAWNNPHPQYVADWTNGRGLDVVLDFEHASELKAPKGDPAPAAAWLSDFRVEEDGRLTAAVNRWSTAGEKAVKENEYRYISPAVIYHPKTMNIIGIGSAGLTNKPNLGLAALNQEHQEDSTMLKALLALLGLPEDATEEIAINAITTLKADLQTATNRAQTPSLEHFVPRADYNIALNRAETAEGKLAQIETDNHAAEVETAINQALTEGKIAPASKEFYIATCATQEGLAQFKRFVETAPFIVADSKIKGDPPEGGATGLNAQEKDICERMGISEEEYLKTTV